MSAEKPTPERIVVDFPKTEIADEKTRRVITEATRLVGDFFRSKLERAEFAHFSLPGRISIWMTQRFGSGAAPCRGLVSEQHEPTPTRGDSQRHLALIPLHNRVSS